MAGHRLVCGRITFDLDTAFEIRTTSYQGCASSTVDGATLRRAVFHVNGSKRAEWKPLANVRKRQKSLGYKKQRRPFLQPISTHTFENHKRLFGNVGAQGENHTQPPVFRPRTSTPYGVQH